MSPNKMNTIRVSDREHATVLALLRYAESIGIAALVANNPDLADLISNGDLFEPLTKTEIGDLATRINCESVPLNDTRSHLVLQNPKLYNGVEVHGVSNVAEPGEDPVYARNDDAPDYFVVNALLKAGGETRIGELATREMAEEFGLQIALLHKWGPQSPDTLKDFTVIGVVSDSGQIVADYVSATDGMQAFAQVAAVRGTVDFVCAMPGHLEDGVEINYPGEGLVDAETVREQTDVFGEARPDAAEAERNGHATGPDF